MSNSIQISLSLSVLRQNKALGHRNCQTWVASTMTLAHKKALEMLSHLFILVSSSLICNTYNYPFWEAAGIINKNL